MFAFDFVAFLRQATWFWRETVVVLWRRATSATTTTAAAAAVTDGIASTGVERLKGAVASTANVRQLHDLLLLATRLFEDHCIRHDHDYRGNPERHRWRHNCVESIDLKQTQSVRFVIGIVTDVAQFRLRVESRVYGNMWYGGRRAPHDAQHQRHLALGHSLFVVERIRDGDVAIHADTAQMQ